MSEVFVLNNVSLRLLLKAILKIIDSYAEEYQPNFYNSPKEKRIKNIEAMKKEISDLFDLG